MQNTWIDVRIIVKWLLSVARQSIAVYMEILTKCHSKFNQCSISSLSRQINHHSSHYWLQSSLFHENISTRVCRSTVHLPNPTAYSLNRQCFVFFLRRFTCIFVGPNSIFIVHLCAYRLCVVAGFFFHSLYPVKIDDRWTQHSPHRNICLHIFDQCRWSFVNEIADAMRCECLQRHWFADTQRYSAYRKQIEKCFVNVCCCGGVWSFIGLFRARASRSPRNTH